MRSITKGAEHMVVVDGRDAAGNFMIRDPANGGSTYGLDPADFHHYWTGQGVIQNP